MRKSRGVMVWLAVLVIALVCAPLVPVRADSGNPPVPPNTSNPSAAVRAAAEPAGARGQEPVVGGRC